jgi:hypothetical protein
MAGPKLIVNEALEKLGEVLVKNMKEDVAVDTGSLRDSIDFYVKDNTLYITMNDYGTYVDNGRAPGKMPPINKIKTWADRKGLNAWAVATNIKKYGIEARPFMTELEEFESKYFDLLETGMFHEIDEYISNNIMKITRK